MKKTILIIILCGLFALTGCEKSKDEEHSFYGKVIKSTSSYIIVEPNEEEMERKSSDKFHIDLGSYSITYEVGVKVKITYVGSINESYPAQIKTTKIEIVKD